MRLVRVAVLAGVPVLFALFSVYMGRDTNWDFLNYRWYDPWAFLHGRLTVDVLVAEHATFYNPLLELPFFLLASHVPGIVAGFLLALASSIAFVPLCLLSDAVLPIAEPNRRFTAAACIGVSALLGGGVLGQIGVVSWDLPLGTLTLFSLWLLCRNNGAALRNSPLPVGEVDRNARSVGRAGEGLSRRLRPASHALPLAGLLTGAAAGLKLTAAIYPLGMAVALLAASQGRLPQRLGRTVSFCLGAGAGLLLCGGYWMAMLYHAFGNPVFPYFNGAFHSVYAAVGSNRDATFLPHGLHDFLLFPFLFTANSLRVAEYKFTDLHIALAWVLGLLAVISPLPAGEVDRRSWVGEGLSRWLRPSPSPHPLPRGEGFNPNYTATRFLFAFAAISFIAWESVFAIYRYILPLEMLASLLVVLAILRLPVRDRGWVAVAVLLAAACCTRAGWNRREWDTAYVSITMPPVPANAMVFLAGDAPLGFAVTALPPGVPALRIGSYLATDNRFSELMQQRIVTHSGSMRVLFAPGSAEAGTRDLARYGLAVSDSGCEEVTSNVSDPLKLCPVTRK